MKLSTSRESLLKPLQAVIGVVERRQTMAVLSNVLLTAKDGVLAVTATDLEVELVATQTVDSVSSPGDITVPGRKLLDICRNLPEGATVVLESKADKVSVRSGRSKFVLSALPATEFPLVEPVQAEREIVVSQAELRRLLERTQFSMAQQDVRYYLNGLLLETSKKRLRAVATDGHRLALCDIEAAGVEGAGQVIVPRKGVQELQRVLDGEGEVRLAISRNHLRVDAGPIRLTSKLIDGRFPDYDRVIPETGRNILVADRESLRHGLQRAAILSNEKFRGVRLELRKNSIRLQANNPDQEEAEDQLEVEYAGQEMDIGFNVNYLLDALAAIETDQVELGLLDANSSCVLRSPGDEHCLYVVMPMRL